MTAEELADRIELLIARRLQFLTANWTPSHYGAARANELCRLRTEIRALLNPNPTT